MAATSLSYVPSNASAAYFRDWGKKISDALAAGGLTKIWSNIDWATANPPSAWQFAGHEIWAFTDALQAMSPIFVLMNYGSAGDGSYPEIQMGVGASHDGNGSLTGTVSYASVQCSYYQTSQYGSNWISVGPSWIVMRVFNGDTNAGQFLSVERLHASDGSDVDGWVLLSSTMGGSFYTISTVKNGVGSSQNAFCSMPSSKTSGSSGAHVATYPIRPWDPVTFQELPPLHNFLGYFSSDMAAGNPTPVVCWDGKTRNYIPTGMYSQQSCPFDKGVSSMYLMMRYE